MDHKNHWDNLNRLRDHDEIKFVLLDRTDYDFAVTVCQRYQLFLRPTAVLFSPVHGLLDPKELVAWILADKLPVRLNLQLHKYIWSAEARGV
jgi:7-carboxy-7-deazaguanine synthase